MKKQRLSKKPRRFGSPPVSPIPSTYRKTTLPNGLRIVSEEIPHVRSVSIGVWIDVGSRDENARTNGISHFIEHMVFKGTRHRSIREISRSIESVGGYLNAFTSKEHTCYYARVLDDYTRLAVDVLADLALHPTFPEKELEKEKGVVIEELRNAEDDPDDIIHDYFEKALYGNHPMGFPVIGTEANLRAFRKTDLLEYKRRHYLPSRVVVAGAGHINHEYLVDLVGKYFPLKGQASQRSLLIRQRPQSRKKESLELSKPIQQAHVCMGTLAYGIKSDHRYPMLVLNTLLGDGMSSRLFQNIREKYGFAYSVYSFVNMLSDTGSFGVYVGTDTGHVNASIDLIQQELEKLKTKPVPEAELERTKAQLKGSMMLSLESIPNRMMRLGTAELYFNELSPLDAIIREINRVSAHTIQRLAKDIFTEERFSRIIFRPTGSQKGNGIAASTQPKG